MSSTTVSSSRWGADRKIWVPIALLVTLPVTVSALLGSWLPLFGLVAAGFALLSLIRPALPVLVMLLVWGGPLDLSVVSRSVAGLQVGPAELALAVGLISVVAARLLKKGPMGSASRPRFLFVTLFYLIAVSLGLLTAHRAGDPTGAAASAWLVSCTVLAYLVLRDAYVGRPRVFAETLVLVTGCISAVVLLSTVLKIKLLTGRSINYVITEGQLSEATRLDPPLLRLLSITLLMATVGGVLRYRRPLIRLLLIAAMLGVEALSFTRSTWVPLIAVAAVLPALVSRRFALVAVIQRLLVAVLIMVILVAVAASGALGSTARTVGLRLSSTTQSDVLQDNSVRLRVEENEAAWSTIRQHPVLGVGFPRPFGVFTTTEADPVTGDDGYEPQRFIHNVYLGLWAWMGLAGVIAVLATATAGVCAFWAVLRRRAVDRRPAVACFGGLVVLAVSSTFQTNLLYQPALFAVAVGLAYLDVWLSSTDRELSEIPGASQSARSPLRLERRAAASA